MSRHQYGQSGFGIESDTSGLSADRRSAAAWRARTNNIIKIIKYFYCVKRAFGRMGVVLVSGSFFMQSALLKIHGTNGSNGRLKPSEYLFWLHKSRTLDMCNRVGVKWEKTLIAKTRTFFFVFHFFFFFNLPWSNELNTHLPKRQWVGKTFLEELFYFYT